MKSNEVITPIHTWRKWKYGRYFIARPAFITVGTVSLLGLCEIGRTESTVACENYARRRLIRRYRYRFLSVGASGMCVRTCRRISRIDARNRGGRQSNPPLADLGVESAGNTRTLSFPSPPSFSFSLSFPLFHHPSCFLPLSSSVNVNANVNVNLYKHHRNKVVQTRGSGKCCKLP